MVQCGFRLVFSSGASALRTCSVPDDKVLFFPVVNSLSSDTPNVCQDANHIPVRELRNTSATMIDAATNVSAELDGERIEHVRRIRSEVFAFVLPEENLFDAPCKSLGNVPPASTLRQSTMDFTCRFDPSSRVPIRCGPTPKIVRSARNPH